MASSSPRSPATMTEKSASTPPSSPPFAGLSPANVVEDGEAGLSSGLSETMRTEEKAMRDASREEEDARNRELEKERQTDLQGGSGVVDNKFKALEYLLSQSKLYSTIMLAQMQKQEETENIKDEQGRKRALKREETAEKTAQVSQRRTTRTAATKTHGDADELGHDEKIIKQQESLPIRGRGRGRPLKAKTQATKGKITDFIKKEDLEGKAGKGATVQEALVEEATSAGDHGIKPGEIGVQNLWSARQPSLVSGGVMRSYQLEGLEWLTSLYENGLNGILADEMGLGKTLQTIAFLAFLREKGINGPFLIAAPLSTTSNWVAEFQRFTPTIPVVLYHGSKQEREEIRRKRLRNPGSKDFPVICTSYEICMNDRKYLSHYGWKYIIIDEGHRIKNLNCRFIRELQSYQSANRLLITGTPLQNNLTELWSLLHFLMPDIFDKLESFESWFDFSALKERNGYQQILSESRKKSLVTSLHAILKPFLLRRIKADVEHSMPKKREYILYAPLSTEQRELYQEILKGNSRAYLEDKVVETLSRTGSGANTPKSTKGAIASLKRKASPANESGLVTPNKSVKTSRCSTPFTNGKFSALGRRTKKTPLYEELSDFEYFKQLEEGDSSACVDEDNSADQAELERASTFALAKKQIAHKKLQNPIMQLRLCCNSPHNFYDPFPELDGPTASIQPDYTTLITASGKMLLFDRLLTGLLSASANHKILIFSQFKTQLDLLSLYFAEIRHIPVCRIDGSIPNTERQEQIHLFNGSDSHRIFLLSTRAGGQGINLASADTVILFDSDWNPQQDLQAQDRAHRIGQRRNVIVYRFATKGTVEEMLLEKADGKRRLEKLVISKGRFKQWGERGQRRKNGASEGEDKDEDDDSSIAELKRLLGRADGEKFDFGNANKQGAELLSDVDLNTLIDRSEEAYERAEKGLDGGDMFKAVETRVDGGGLLAQMSK